MWKETPYVVFGAQNKPNHTILLEENPVCGQVALHICNLNNEDGNISFGDRDKDVPVENISGEAVKLFFCNKNSIKAMIDILQTAYNKWEDCIPEQS